LLKPTHNRKNVPLDPDQLQLLELLTTEGTRERAALRELVSNVRRSEASVLSALVMLGGRVVREEALATGYNELVARNAANMGNTTNIATGGTDD
jgi:hypothetical protein